MLPLLAATPALLYVIGGAALILAVVLPRVLERWPLSAPLVLIGVGAALGHFLVRPTGVLVDPLQHRTLVEHVTELTVIVSLMGVGLALDRSLVLRSWSSWREWSATWKLLVVAMPLCIGAMFVLGWGLLGIAAGPALLLAAALAPTDPVLASDVQVEGPDVESEAEEISEDDEVRFALTSEAGLNDGLAFPFVHAAVLLATAGSVAQWGPSWLLGDVVVKTLIGVVVGVAVGRGLAWIAFRTPFDSLRVADQGEALYGIAALAIAYGLGELAHGWAFLSVFMCGMAMRAADPGHKFHEAVHTLVERLERLLTLFVLLLVGIALADGSLAALDWRSWVLASALIFVIRPLAGAFSLWLGSWRMTRPGHRRVERSERLITAFFGVRGVGSLYYVAWAMGKHAMPEEGWLWATVLLTIVMSAIVHGGLSAPVLAWLERRRDQGTPRPFSSVLRPGQSG